MPFKGSGFPFTNSASASCESSITWSKSDAVIGHCLHLTWGLRVERPPRPAASAAHSGQWSGSGEAEVVARCVERNAELAGVAADLGEEEAALHAGHGGDR